MNAHQLVSGQTTVVSTNQPLFFTAKKLKNKPINTHTNTQKSQMMWKLSWGGADETQWWKV